MSDDRNYVKRRHMFIEPQEQGIFMIRAWVYCLIFAGTAFTVIYHPGPQWQLSDAQRATNQFLFYHADKWPWLVLPFVLVGLVSVIGSHRIFGPVLGLKNTIRRVLDKDLSVRFSGRTGDHFEELSVLVNQLIEHNRTQTREYRSIVRQIQADMAGGRTAEAQAQLKRLVDEFDRYKLD